VSSRLEVTGALTTVNRTSAANAFTLQGRVGAGACEDLLFMGGVGADAGSQNWYLRSDLCGCAGDHRAVSIRWNRLGDVRKSLLFNPIERCREPASFFFSRPAICGSLSVIFAPASEHQLRSASTEDLAARM